MADIFISYSKKDSDKARYLASFLEAEGYSVWWDKSLLSGDQYRKVIMTELARARVALVLWTKNSVTSDWVQSEAGRAHAQQKLVPVKDRSLEYSEIPSPFDNQHTENIDARPNILAAIQAQISRPVAAPAFWKRARYETLSWFGVIGASVTLATNFRGLIALARSVGAFLENWVTLITLVLRNVLFFLPSLGTTDAVFISVIVFMTLNLAMCVRAQRAGDATFATMVSPLVPVAIILQFFRFGFWQSDYAGYSNRYIDLIWGSSLGELYVYLQNVTGSPAIDAVFFLYHWALRLLTYAVIPILVAALPVAMITFLLGLSLDYRALSARLWRIVAGVVLVLILNYATLWAERLPLLNRILLNEG